MDILPTFLSGEIKWKRKISLNNLEKAHQNMGYSNAKKILIVPNKKTFL